MSLGGDSLSYVEMSVRLEQALGPLPMGGHTMSIRNLNPRSETWRAIPRRLRTLDTGVALRAASIVLTVGSHIGLQLVRASGRQDGVSVAG